MQTSAHDQLLLLDGKSVKIIERSWERVVDRCTTWTNEDRLQYNISSTQERNILKLLYPTSLAIVDREGHVCCVGAEMEHLIQKKVVVNLKD